MPHKHKRKRDDDKSNFDLPPTSKAKPLPVRSNTIFEKPKAKQSKRPRKTQDDTPKAFARLMAFQTAGKRTPSGLDDGQQPSHKKSKTKPSPLTPSHADSKPPEPEPSNPTTSPLKILPHERLAEFNARVDQSLPFSTVPRRTTNNNIPGLKAPLTKHNKRLARMQAEWRATDAKVRQRREEAAEEMADQVEEESLLWLGVEGSRKRKGKKKNNNQDDADPWKVLEKKRRGEGVERQKNLQDVVMAPPVLKEVKSIFREKDDGQRRASVKVG